MTTTKTKRKRRSPDELIAQLEAKLDRLGERSDTIAERIERIRKRNAKALALAKFADVPADELARQLEEARKAQKLLREALKAKAADDA